MHQTEPVNPLSSPAVGCAADIAKDAFSEGELEILFMRAGLDRFVPKTWYGKAKLVAPTVKPSDPSSVRGRIPDTRTKFGQDVRTPTSRPPGRWSVSSTGRAAGRTCSAGRAPGRIMGRRFAA